MDEELKNENAPMNKNTESNIDKEIGTARNNVDNCLINCMHKQVSHVSEQRISYVDEINICFRFKNQPTPNRQLFELDIVNEGKQQKRITRKTDVKKKTNRGAAAHAMARDSRTANTI